MTGSAFVARGSLRHLLASTLAAVLATFGMVVLGVGILVGPAGAVLGVTSIGLLAWQWRRLPRRMLVVDAPGPDARLWHGRDGAASLLLADVAGGILQRTAGMTYRGWRTGADVEHWLLVGDDGQRLARVDGQGLSPDDLREARRRIGGTWITAREARDRGLMPADAPWGMRHPGGSVAVVLAATAATIALLAGIGILLTALGRPALLWPWW
ncbi:hypothetical protein GCM10009846_06760 [Agrococcus versicolor]|uniref:PH domain-containing protein n=1 Tax=Agrococcus versicolor TaxID=501482 RepID=A0ABN3AKW3_9MICO